MNRIIERAFHLGQRIVREGKVYPKHKKEFGAPIARAIFRDGVIPPGKSASYIKKIETYVEQELKEYIQAYHPDQPGAFPYPGSEKIPVWVCWWQGEENMPELVRTCYRRLHEIIDPGKMEIRLITLANYQEYIIFPAHIERKFAEKRITMATLSDMLRLSLLSQYGGWWVDATVYFTEPLPDDFFSHAFYSQKMAKTPAAAREACKSLWCGFCMAGYAGVPLFSFARDAFFFWWEKHDDIVDYVLIDYLILMGYRHVPEIRALVDAVPDNNVGVFEMYQHLNDPYGDALWERLTQDNRIHKLTYKMELHKETLNKEQTLYGWLTKDTANHG